MSSAVEKPVLSSQRLKQLSQCMMVVLITRRFFPDGG